MSLAPLTRLLASIWLAGAVIAQIDHSILPLSLASQAYGDSTPTHTTTPSLFGPTDSWTTSLVRTEATSPTSSPTPSSESLPVRANVTSETFHKRQDSIDPAEYVTPFIEYPRVCHNEADFLGHADIRSHKQYEMVQRFCQSDKGRASLSKARNDNAPFPAVRYRGIDKWGINHDFKVEWKRGCNTKYRVQSIQLPLGPPPDVSPICVNLMRANYDNCDNGGVGGSVQVGCLIYTYNGGRGGSYW